MPEKRYRDIGTVRVSFELLHQLLRIPDELVIIGLDTSDDLHWPGTLTLQVQPGGWPPGFAGKAIGMVHDYTLGRKSLPERIDDERTQERR